MISPISFSFDPIATQLGVNKQFKHIFIKNISDRTKLYHSEWKWDTVHSGIDLELRPTYPFNLPAGEKQGFDINLTIDPNAEGGIYSGRIILTSEQEEWHVPVLAMVEPAGYVVIHDDYIKKIGVNDYKLSFISNFPEVTVKFTITRQDQTLADTTFNVSFGRSVIPFHLFDKGTYIIGWKALTYPTKAPYETGVNKTLTIHHE